MLNIASILQSIHEDIVNKSDKVEVLDDEHVVDKVSGVEFYLYDDYFQMRRGKEKPVTHSVFSENEQHIIMQIKNAITSPQVTQEKLRNYKVHQEESRRRFSDWFENPKPIHAGTVVEETDTEQYVR